MDDSSPPTPELPELKNRLSSNSGIKRNKVSRACDECRKRKVRCDGAQPCARCQRSPTECIFSNVTPKRGPPKQYLEPFENRLKAIDTVLHVLESSSQETIPIENKNNWKKTDPVIGTNIHLDVTCFGQALYIPDFPARIDRLEPIQNFALDSEPPPPPGLPDQNTIRFDLVRLYFDHIHPSMPFLSRSLFTQPQPPTLLLHAIYAVASKFVQQDSSDPPGWSFYKTALSLIDAYADMPRLSTVQALVLLCKYHEHVHRPGFLYRTKFFIQMAMRMANDLGLSRKIPDICHVQEEARIRTFWVMQTYSTLISIEQGLELPTQECTVGYPHVLSDESGSSDANAVLYFYWLCKVIHVQLAVIQFMKKFKDHVSGNDMEQFIELENTLIGLGTNIPHTIDGDVRVSFVHLIYHLTVILLFRPYALTNTIDQRQQRAISHCSTSASTVANIIDNAVNTHGKNAFSTLIRSNQQVIYCLTTAATMLHALKDPSEAYERICSMLQIMTSKSPVTELETTPVSADVERPDLHIVSPSNTSSTRSSPLIPSLSPHSPTPTIRKRHSRSSLQFPVSDMPYGNEVHRRRHSGRSPYAANRLSAPALGSMYQTYFYQQQQQQQLQQLQQLQSYSQPSSPIISQFGTNDYTTFPTTPHRTASLSRKTGLRRSASSTGDFMIPPQRPRAPSRPYMNPRRHTLTNATPPDLSNEIASSPSVDTTRNLYAMAVRNNQFNTQPYMIPITSHHQHQQMQQQQQQHQQLLQQQQLQQTLMLDPASFPMDPVIPDSPNDSMMNLLLNPWDFSSQ